MDLSIWATLSSLSWYLLPLFLLLVFLEQISYLKKKATLPGPALVFPFLGNIISLVKNPTRFWDTQADMAKTSPHGVSANYITGKFLVFVRSTDLSHKVLTNIRPDAFQFMPHPFGKKLFGDQNLSSLVGQDHKDLRRLVAPSFTPRALSLYVSIQRGIVADHLGRWLRLSDGKPIALRWLCRELVLEVLQNVFLGPYLLDELKEGFNYDYHLFHVGLMSLPIDLPGFAFREARLAAKRLVQTLGGCAKASKKKMEVGGHEPSCLIDFWTQEIIRQTEAAAESGNPPPQHSTPADLGDQLFDFMFAAQDTSTSSLAWALVLLDSHQEVLAKVRREVASIWSPESAITADQLLKMKYTQAVAREVLRIRTPATIVPHIARKDFPLTDSYTIPKGAIVFPSIYESSFQGFVEPYRFDPDRFMDERQEDRVYKKNFLVFGAGPHQCVGQRYATNFLVLFIAMFTSLIDFKRHRSDGCDDIVYAPAISPKDDCKVSLIQRCAL